MAEEPASSPPRLFTWANAVTLARLLIVPVLVWSILQERALLAFTLFVAACASDFADGGLARRLGQSSSLGGLLDHATDATLIVAGLAALSMRDLVPTLLPLLVAAAFLQYVLDSRAATGQPLRPNPIGHWNGIAYYVLLGTPLVRDAAGKIQYATILQFDDREVADRFNAAALEAIGEFTFKRDFGEEPT